MSTASAPTAGLRPRDGPRGGGAGATQTPGGLGSYQVHKADGSQRPNYGVANIDEADRAGRTDPHERKPENWI